MASHDRGVKSFLQVRFLKFLSDFKELAARAASGADGPARCVSAQRLRPLQSAKVMLAVSAVFCTFYNQQDCELT